MTTIMSIFPKRPYENEVYLGVPGRLWASFLKQAGKQLIVATSKPEEFSIQSQNHLLCMIIFDF